jgi:hypothetical protein
VFRSIKSIEAKAEMDAKPKKDGVPTATRDLYTKIQQTQKVFDVENANRIEREKASVKAVEALGLDKDFANIQPETVTYRGQKITLSKQNQIDIATYLAGKTKLVQKHWSDPALVDAANQAKRRLDKAGIGELAERYLQKERMGVPNPITFTTGIISELGSGLKDLFSEGSTNAFSTNNEVKYLKLAQAISNKSYSKVVDEQAKIIKMQYNINPNKGFTLSTGNAEDDRYLKAQLGTFMSAFTRNDDYQNLATKEEFEAFQTNLKDKDLSYTITSESDEKGNPVWAVVDNDGGRIVLNPDQSAQLGYNVNDIYEPDSVLYLRNKLNIRLTPQILLVLASMHPKAKKHVRHYASTFVIKRPDDIKSIVLFWNYISNNSLMPKQLRLGIADAMSHMSIESLVKYDGNEFPRWKDILKIVPRFTDYPLEKGLCDYFINGTINSESNKNLVLLIQA